MESVKTLDQSQVEVLTLEAYRVAIQEEIDLVLLDTSVLGKIYFQAQVKKVSGRLCAEIEALILGNDMAVQTLIQQRVPATLWHHIKSSLPVPKWLLRLFPVKWREIPTTIRLVHVCPHLGCKDPGVHYAFLRPPAGRAKLGKGRKMDPSGLNCKFTLTQGGEGDRRGSGEGKP
jgi:hypothetical protein